MALDPSTLKSYHSHPFLSEEFFESRSSGHDNDALTSISITFPGDCPNGCPITSFYVQRKKADRIGATIKKRVDVGQIFHNKYTVPKE
jgi:hypothetical protein